MDLFNVISFIGGLAFFLFGMNQLSTGLETMVGGKFEKVLSKMTSNRFSALGLGAAATALVQSSSTVTVIVVGLVNSGIMTLKQSVGVIMGSNIGTTITAWILSLIGLESSNIAVKMLKPDSFAPILAFIGIIYIMFIKSPKKKNWGTILVGFGILMSGMSVMGDSVESLKDVPEFANLMVMFSNPIMGVLAGAIITAIIQSSSASVGILQSLSMTGAVPFSSALPIIMGQNIGTCVTALISSIGANKNAKRVTAVHIYFNVIGTLICLPAFLIINSFIHFEFMNQAAEPFMIAVAHTTFNIVTTVILFPFAKHIQKLAERTVKNEKENVPAKTILDERLLLSPNLAIAESHNVTEKMARLVLENYNYSIAMLEKYDDKIATVIQENEVQIDLLEDRIGVYLVKINKDGLTEQDGKHISQLLHTIGDLERIADHCTNVLEVAYEMADKKAKLSSKATEEINIISRAVKDILDMSIESFLENNADRATYVEPLEDVVDELKFNIRSRHIQRLKDGSCSIELGFILSDLVSNFERISDHCSNIAIWILEYNLDDGILAHDYHEKLKDAKEISYEERYDAYKHKYRLPKS